MDHRTDSGPIHPVHSGLGTAALPGRELLQRLPMAMLLLDAGGQALWFNDRFGQMFDPSALDLKSLAGGECPAVPARRSLAGRDGTTSELLVHCVPLQEARLLLLDSTPGSVDAAVLQDLQARVTQLEHDSLTDRLTGAWNRRYLDQSMVGELARSRRYRQPLSAAMLDIDHFKAVNDTFGHATGDSVLKELVAVARGCVRAADVLARWGGEEFLVLMPFTAYGAAAVAT